MRRFIAIVIGLVSMWSMAGVRAAGDPEAGKTKAAACAGCHGLDGNSSNPQWPKLAGQPADYTVKQLKAFQSGVRKDPLMSPMAAPLSEADMADIAAYFAGQTPSVGTADPNKVDAGGRLYRAGNRTSGVPACMACHGPEGHGVPGAAFPALSGQHGAYVLKQLNDFRSGARTNDPSKMMRDIAARMSAEEMDAVADFVQGLH